VFFFIVRKPENYTIDKKIETKNVISSEKIEETKNEEILSLSTSSCTETSSNLSRPSQMKNAVENNYKIDAIQPKLFNSLHNLSDINSVKSPKLGSDQYIKIFNRYQVLQG